MLITASHYIVKLVAGFSQKLSLLNSMPSISNKSLLLNVFTENQEAHLECAESTEVHIGVCYKNKKKLSNICYYIRRLKMMTFGPLHTSPLPWHLVNLDPLPSQMTGLEILSVICRPNSSKQLSSKTRNIFLQYTVY